MKKRLLGWLDRRETSQTLMIAKEQMRKALDTVYELEKSIKEASQGDFESGGNRRPEQHGKQGIEVGFFLIRNHSIS